ncbi:MAG TPA: formate--tetrahydrofolate ligase [Gammaproteobacteria bacterium]|nr:formate--tetrahydrofolate ligase [Gammaproteobacteria bacterium]
MSESSAATGSRLKHITEVAADLDIPAQAVEPYGHHKGKLDLNFLAGLSRRENGKLVLVSAMSPTPAGEGKTTTSIGLADGLRRVGKRSILCLREPSLGPVFGMKGGATGGGASQVAPAADINLHFNGDFAAIALANNLLAALLDNHVHHGNALGIDVRRIGWRRVVDLNDRALRQTVTSLGGAGNGFPRQDGFDIVAASEIMAILCLATDLDDLRMRLGNIVLGYTREQQPLLARDLHAAGPMTALLKDALKPNLVQTLEGTPAFIHGGPFANIAHGCNSAMATLSALKLGEYVVTEAGFGADLGAEKFIDIKCRKTGLRPDAAVLVATIRALKYQGGVKVEDLDRPNLQALEKGLANLERHLNNVRNYYGLPCVVAINHFVHDTDEECDLVRQKLAHHGVKVVLARHFAEGGKGAEDLALAVVDAAETGAAEMKFVYEDEQPLWDKVSAVATRIYGASEVTADTKIRARIAQLQAEGYGHYPICIAKTQYSFSTDPKRLGAPTGHVLNIREVRLAAGAEFIVLVCGGIMTMPGLPREPAAKGIDVDDRGEVVGLA